MRDNIAIIGLMDNYNGVVAKTLSDSLEMHLLDLAELVSYVNATPISCILSDYGVKFYAKLETAAIMHIDDYKDTVLHATALASINPDNLKSLTNDYIIVLLTANKEQIISEMDQDAGIINREDFILNYTKYARNLTMRIKPLADLIIDVTHMSPIVAAQTIEFRLLEMYNSEQT